MHARTIIAAAAAVTALATAGVATAAPAANAVDSVNATCVVSKAGKIKQATTVTITGKDLAGSFLGTTGCQQPVAIVRKVATTGIEKPFRSGLFACTPSVSGSSAKWKCVFNAADTDGTATLSFTYKY